MSPTGVTVLGATGSIGLATLDVVRTLGDFEIVALAAGSKWEPLVEIVNEFRPKLVALADEEAAGRLREAVRGSSAAVISGPEAALEAATLAGAEVVVSAIVGAAGLEPTLAATRLGRRIALANKESLVMAGPLLLEEAATSGATLVPVDSEHSAIFQARAGGHESEVRRIILTASGGPFRSRTDGFDRITAAEALAHPTWSMGPKISIDSATLINKALEVIEARWIFGLDSESIAESIEVWIHPQSVVHSMVEFVDGSILAQLGPTDMRLPIQFALTYPARRPGALAGFTLERMSALTFERPDMDRFPGLSLGFRAAREGGVSGAVLNAANEAAVGCFLAGGCSFTDIARTAERAMDAVAGGAAASLEDVWNADKAARAFAVDLLGRPEA